MSDSVLRLGTRSSALARWQADWVAARLKELGAAVELVLITTQGDARTGSLAEIGGQGLFTKEIQRALLDQRVDLAVHSLKDLPTDPVDGLTLGAVPERAPIGDCLVTNLDADWQALPDAARIGTGSVRRQAQLLHVRPDLTMLDIRGNVDTRLRKLDEGQYDAIVLAEAGLRRLGLEDRIRTVIPTDIMLPAVGQGALGIEIRVEDSVTADWVGQLNDRHSHAAVVAERRLLAALRAGCLAPVGAWARVEQSQLRLDAVVLSRDGRQRLTASATSTLDRAAELGQQLADKLADDGATQLISDAR